MRLIPLSTLELSEVAEEQDETSLIDTAMSSLLDVPSPELILDVFVDLHFRQSRGLNLWGAGLNNRYGTLVTLTTLPGVPRDYLESRFDVARVVAALYGSQWRTQVASRRTSYHEERRIPFTTEELQTVQRYCRRWRVRSDLSVFRGIVNLSENTAFEFDMDPTQSRLSTSGNQLSLTTQRISRRRSLPTGTSLLHPAQRRRIANAALNGQIQIRPNVFASSSNSRSVTTRPSLATETDVYHMHAAFGVPPPHLSNEPTIVLQNHEPSIPRVSRNPFASTRLPEPETTEVTFGPNGARLPWFTGLTRDNVYSGTLSWFYVNFIHLIYESDGTGTLEGIGHIERRAPNFRALLEAYCDELGINLDRILFLYQRDFIERGRLRLAPSVDRDGYINAQIQETLLHPRRHHLTPELDLNPGTSNIDFEAFRNLQVLIQAILEAHRSCPGLQSGSSSTH